jgi:hypothetical protein
VTFTGSKKQWLESLLEERFGHRLVIRGTDEGRGCELMLLESERRIGFPQLVPEFQETGTPSPGLGCGLWPVAPPFRSPLGFSDLPAPSSRPLASPLIESDDAGYLVHYDILGLAYWSMNRLEEVGARSLDEHQRFPASQSHAFRHDYLHRPVVDEWLHVLGQVIKQSWPGLALTQHEFQINLSHDVDRPSRYGFRSLGAFLRGVTGDLLLRRAFKTVALAPLIRLGTRQRLHPLDPYNTFDWIMAQSERLGLASTFNFICGRRDPSRDPDYDLDHPAVRRLMLDLHQRGHLLGLHPSYHCFNNPQMLNREHRRLLRACDEEGIRQDSWGGRMHYLRWEHPLTLNLWAAEGLDYDGTLGFADRPGFRCGTCFEFNAFDPVSERLLDLRLRPLTVMEASVLSPTYMDVSSQDEAFEIMANLKGTCRALGGQFNLLWHNSELLLPEHCNLYVRLLEA